MIKSLFGDKKLTANQYAKQLVLDAMDARSCGMWDDADSKTDKEMLAITDAYDKLYNRLYKQFGMDKINAD